MPGDGSDAGTPEKWDSLVVQVEQELVVQPLDVFAGRDDALEVLVLSAAVDGVVHHDTVHVRVVVCLLSAKFWPL